MYKKLILLITSLVLFFGCNSEESYDIEKAKALNKRLGQLQFNYYLKNNANSLDTIISIYDSLKEKGREIYISQNSQTFLGTFLILKKFKEFDFFIENYKTHYVLTNNSKDSIYEDFAAQITKNRLNYARHVLDKNSTVDSKKYLIKAVQITEKTMKYLEEQNIKDTMIPMAYYISKSLLFGKDSILKELDSVKKENIYSENTMQMIVELVEREETKKSLEEMKNKILTID